MKRFFWQLLSLPFVLLTTVLVFILPKKRNILIWGPTPLINNKYWSQALREANWESQTLMTGYYAINTHRDYDLYYNDLIPQWVKPQYFRNLIAPCFAMIYMMRHARVVHFPFHGGPWGQTWLWRLEAYLFRWAGIKMIVMPYGADAYIYSQIIDPSLRHALLLSYPDAAKTETQVAHRLAYWNRHADVILTGFMLDGLARWDVPINNMICIDLTTWQVKSVYSTFDGKNGPVKIIHTPNHRGFKGTEFLVEAVKELQAEGLKIELLLLEKIPNDQVRQMMQTVDILAEQFIFTGYALSGIEGMASGLPVLANLDQEIYTRIFRRYAFLNECPIISTSPEMLKTNLRALITHPELRRELGQAGRQYVEKYHSAATARYLFGSIYDKILHNKPVDLMNLFHPLKSSYNHSRPIVKHPLIENRLPARYLTGSPEAAQILPVGGDRR